MTTTKITMEQVDEEVYNISNLSGADMSIEDKLDTFDFEIAAFSNDLAGLEYWSEVLTEVIWGCNGVTLEDINDANSMGDYGVISEQSFYEEGKESIDMLFDVKDAITYTEARIKKLQAYRDFITPEPVVLPEQVKQVQLSLLVA